LHRGIEREHVRWRGSKIVIGGAVPVKVKGPTSIANWDTGGLWVSTIRSRTPTGKAGHTTLMDKMSGHGHITRKGVAVHEQNPIAASSEQQAQRAASTSRAYHNHVVHDSLLIGMKMPQSLGEATIRQCCALVTYPKNLAAQADAGGT
jgi:hypothetical protein